MEKYICIHGHFYQPPRENPWLEEIEVQDSAYPYRDWNERITAECYNPNTAARILENNATVIDIVNNYSKISFNFGPTLLSWLQSDAPDVYDAVLKADKQSREKFSGHGSAIAQVYGHTIMPLNSSRDKKTQVIWGIEDFKKRFKRDPEGMWLAETAVDLETLDILAEHSIKFTILAPRQASRVREITSNSWTDVKDGTIDPKKPYLCRLPSGRTINLFFYDVPISQELAFGPLLKSGENLANRLIQTFNPGDSSPQIVHIATDGETYGHHQKHGDMALAYCLHFIEKNNLAKITVYGEFLEKFPPVSEVEIIENTSWSCIHGIERWKSNCGCNSGRDGWHQEWREPLREALDWLRDSLITVYEEEMQGITGDAWKLRDDYIRIILDRSPESIAKVLSDNGFNDPDGSSLVKILKLLEMQRHTMLMYTSCGWFFDEISGIETVQVILYAARALQLCKDITGQNLEPDFLKKLETIKSNIPEFDNGRKIYESFVKPAIIDLLRVAAHYAVSALFEKYSEKSRVFCYEVQSDDYEHLEVGKVTLAMGRALMRSQITYEQVLVTHAFFHLGDHNLNGGVRESRSMKDYSEMKSEFKDVFKKLNYAEIILLIDKHFGTHNYTLWHLFKDESRRVFSILTQDTLNDIEFYLRQIYENHYPIMLAMKETGTPLPAPMAQAIEFVLNSDLKKHLESGDSIDLESLHNIYEESMKWNVELDKRSLGYAASNKINWMMNQLVNQPDNFQILTELNTLLKILKLLGIELNLWRAQNILFLYSREHLKKVNGKGEEWHLHFNQLEEHLAVRVL